MFDLQRAWPEACATHNISDTELERIAARARSVEHAQEIWEHMDDWVDPVELETRQREH